MSTTRTANAALQKPGVSDRSWDVPLNANADALDATCSIGSFAVTLAEYPSASLNVKVAGGRYRKTDGSVGTYAGTASYAIPASTTKALWLTNAGVLTAGSSFPTTPHVPLATVVAGASTITSVADGRIVHGVVGV